MRFAGTTPIVLILLFAATITAARTFVLGDELAMAQVLQVLCFAFLPVFTLSIFAASVEQCTAPQARSFQLIATVGGLYLVLHHPDFSRVFFSQVASEHCFSTIAVLRAVKESLFMGGVLSAVIFIPVGTFELLASWSREVKTPGVTSSTLAAYRMLCVTLVIAMLGERIVSMFFEKTPGGCSAF